MAGPGTSPKKLDAQEFATAYKHTLFHALDSIDLGNVGKAIEILAEARAKSRTVFLCGNGGSASTASHFSVDLSKGASFQRESRFRVHALTDSLPIITAYCNDVGYESIFVEQLKNLARPGDVLVTISASGNSPNVLRAAEYANSIGCKTIAFTGRDGGKLGALSQLQIRVAEPHIGRIEDSHMAICHMISFYFMERT